MVRYEMARKEKKMTVDLISYTKDAALLCGEAAAICTNAGNTESAFCHAVDSGHTSILEHAVFTFKITGLSRAALAQLTRHRLASFDVQSQRYVRLNDDYLVLPKTIIESQFCEEAKRIMSYVMKLYQEMVDKGIPKEDARYITPQAVSTELIMTMNARELLHFFALRTCDRAQWEIRELADKMLMLCKQVSPKLFIVAGPGCVTGKCTEKKPCGKPRDIRDWE